jgi:hypothetical protein
MEPFDTLLLAPKKALEAFGHILRERANQVEAFERPTGRLKNAVEASGRDFMDPGKRIEASGQVSWEPENPGQRSGSILAEQLPGVGRGSGLPDAKKSVAPVVPRARRRSLTAAKVRPGARQRIGLWSRIAWSACIEFFPLVLSAPQACQQFLGKSLAAF